MTTATEQSMYRQDIELRDTAARHDRLPDWRNEFFIGIDPYRARVRELARIVVADQQLLPKWREVRNYYDPEMGRWLYTDFCIGVHTKYSKSDTYEVEMARHRIVNSVSTNIINTCAAGIKYAFTSANKPWFSFAPSNKALSNNMDVRLWLDATRDTVRDAMAQSNFYSEMDKVYREASLIGVGVCTSEPDPQRKLNYNALTVGEYVLDENERGEVDTCYQRIEMTARQLKQKFGADNKGFTDAVRQSLSRPDSLSDTYIVFRAMQPINTFGDAPVRIQEEWKYESVYFLDCAEDATRKQQYVLRWEWHRTQPFVAVRWKRTSRHVYGTCPGKDVLAEQKMLQSMTTTGMNAMEMQVDIPVIAGAQAYQRIVKHGRLSPGAVFLDDPSVGRDRQVVQPVLQGYHPDFVNFAAFREETIQRIKDAFYFDQWRAIVNIERQMTAFEVDARLNEKISLLAPVYESFASQAQTPILERNYSICLHDLGLILPPPEAMRGQEFRIEYEGDYAKSIKQVEVERIQQYIRMTLEAATNLAALSPEEAVAMVGTIDFAKASRMVSQLYDVTPEVVRGEEQVREIVERHQQQMAQQQQAATAQQTVDSAQTLGNTPVDPNNALGQIMAQLGGGSMNAA